MQRNILKIALVCGMALFLAAAPVHPLNAAETAIDTGAQDIDGLELRETYYVTAQNGLKMRSGPSKDSDVITLLPYGAEVTVIGTSSGGWYEIEYANDNGYVSEKYVAKSDETDSDSDNNAIEDNDNVPSTAPTFEGIQTTLGITPIIIALIAAIIIMILLAIYTAYSFLKKDKKYYDDDNDEEYIDDTVNDEYNDSYDDYDDNNDDNEYIDEEYCDADEYYNDEEYYDEDE